MHWGIFLTILAVVVSRLVGPLAGGEIEKALANVSPLAAVVVAGAIYLPRRAAFAVPFGALFISTLAVNAAKGWPLLDLYTFGAVMSFAAIFGVAWWARGTKSVIAVFGISLGGTVLHYLLSNTMAFAFEPGYERSLAGWWQSQTLGLPIPGAPPAWWFFVKSLAGDLLFTALMVVACHPFPRRSSAVAAPVIDAA